jgi:hypothetical protein
MPLAHPFLPYHTEVRKLGEGPIFGKDEGKL